MLNQIEVEFKSSYLASSNPEIKAALKQGLGLPLLSFPAVFVRGAFLGGFEQLQDAISTDSFKDILTQPMCTFPADAAARPDPVKLWVGPRGQSWFAFQLHVYANYVRMLSLLHVVLFAVMMAISDAAPGLATGLLWLVMVDLGIFTLTGPTPLAPVSTLVSLFVWRFRGNAVTSVPYKLIMGAGYVYTMISIVTCSGFAAGGGELFGGVVYQVGQCPNQIDQTRWVCGDRKDEECPSQFNFLFGKMLVNSVFLAFFRF